MQSNTDDIDMQPSNLKIQCVKYIAGFFQLFQKSWMVIESLLNAIGGYVKEGKLDPFKVENLHA